MAIAGAITVGQPIVGTAITDAKKKQNDFDTKGQIIQQNTETYDYTTAK